LWVPHPGVLAVADAVLDPCAFAIAHLQPGDISVGLVGDEAGVPVAVLVEDRELRAGVRPFATGDQPSALRPRRQVQTVGELSNPRPVPKLAVAVNRPNPLGFLSFEDLLADRLIDRGGRSRSGSRPYGTPRSPV